MKKIGIIFLLLYPILSFAQETLCVKGYVIDEYGILSDVLISIRGREINTITDNKGRFKIQCNINDTLEFKSTSHYIPIIYIVKNNSFLVIKLQLELKYENGHRQIYARAIPTIYKHSIQLSSTFNESLSINLGYTNFINPNFSKHSNCPLNNLGFGLNASLYNQRYVLFPNLTLNIKGFYKTNYSTLSFFVPQVKVGYYFNIKSPQSNNSFGYNLEMGLFSTYVKRTQVSINLSYNNYSFNHGVFMLGLSITSPDKRHNKIEILY